MLTGLLRSSMKSIRLKDGMELEFGNMTENSKHCILAARFMTTKRCCLDIQGGALNVIPLIVHITHFYYYKSI